MKKIFTKQYMLENCGCYGKEKTMGLFFLAGNDTITIDDILNANIPIKDKYWFVCRKTGIDKRINQQISIDLAEITLPIFERRRPNDTRPREAIEAAKQFIAGHISLTQLIEKRLAPAYDNDAYDNDAAYAADAASYAAAAADAGNAADNAADAASYAAAAATADAADDIKKQIEQYLIEFIKSQPEYE